MPELVRPQSLRCRGFQSDVISERTKGRPLASGRVSVLAAVIYLILQYIGGILFFLPYNGVAFWAVVFQLLPLYVCLLNCPRARN